MYNKAFMELEVYIFEKDGDRENYAKRIRGAIDRFFMVCSSDDVMVARIAKRNELCFLECYETLLEIDDRVDALITEFGYTWDGLMFQLKAMV